MLRSRRSLELVLALAVATIGLALPRAANAEVAVRIVAADARIEDTSYGINARLGRAWAVFFLMDRTFNTEAGPATSGPTPTLVPGLSYQPDTQEIRFVEPGQPPVVCARVVPKKFLFFHWNKVVPTGQCGITRIEDRVNTTDTGFGLAKSRERVIYFGRAPQGRASL